MEQTTDKEVIEQCKKGDTDSFRKIYGRYAKAMYHTCLRIAGNETDAEDLLQEGFVEAFTSLERLKDSNAFAGWLKRIMINRSVNYVKRQRKSWQEIDSSTTQYHEDEPFDEEGFSKQIQAIHIQLARLPDPQRITISLHVYEAMGFEEIASVLRVPSATVRSHYARGRKRILNNIKS